jgi:transposase
MKIHANARTCPNSRKLLVKRIEEENWSLMVAAEAAGISERSARKWLARWRTEGDAGLLDRSSAPKRVPSRLPSDRLEAIEALRRLRMTAAEIAEVLGMALSTVSRWLARIGLGKRSRLEPLELPNRYERKRREEARADQPQGGGTQSHGDSKSQHRATHRERQAASGHRLGVRPRLRR